MAGELLDKPDVKSIFDKYAEMNPEMLLLKEVRKFFAQEQGEIYDDI